MIGRKGCLQLLSGAAVIVVIADLLVTHHPHFSWQAIPGWSALYGLLSCVAIIFVSKWLGHKLFGPWGGLMRSTDHYQRQHPKDQDTQENSPVNQPNGGSDD